MKFCKKYGEYMRRQQKQLPLVGFKNLKKILKRCPGRSRISRNSGCDHAPCPHRCSVCDGSFFPSLLQEMSAIVGCFNNSAQELMEAHLSSGFRKCVIWLKGNRRRDHAALMQEGEDLVTYALVNEIAIRKILKKYDKIHLSTQGQAFKSRAQSMRVEILKSPWVCELMACHINLRETRESSGKVTSLVECSLIFNDNKPSLACEVLGLVKVEVDVTCSICLDTVFDPVCLTCGHILCYICACSAASVTIVDGLKVAEPKGKCPLCRESRVYQGAVHLDELNRLLSRSCLEYWEERMMRERVERVNQAKEHWESQCRAFMGT